jgi:putative peptidoglycan lipid II flippase
MVGRVFGFFQKETTSIHIAAYVLGGAAILSQILGLIRDKLLAYNLGASRTLDLYYAAFRIPDALFATVASLVSLSVLIPFLSETLARSREDARHYIDQVFTVFMLLMIAVVAVAWYFVPTINQTLFPSLVATNGEELTHIARVLLLSPLFLGISNLLASITQTYNRFAIYAASPVLYNLGIITGIVAFYPIFGIVGLAWGVVLGTVLHMAIQLPFLFQYNLLPRVTFAIAFKRIKEMVFISLPRTLTISATELSELVLISLASFLTIGSVAIFTFAWNLQSVPLSIIGVSYSLAVFPTLTKLFTKGNMHEFAERISTAARHIIFWSVPATALIIILRAHLVRTILGAGAFDWTETRLTAAALSLFTISLLPQGLSLLFVRAQYARGTTWVPFSINIFTALTIISGGYLFTHLAVTNQALREGIETIFRVQGLPGTEVLLLPLAYSLGMYINLILHWLYAAKVLPHFSKQVLIVFMQNFAASVLAAGAAYGVLSLFGPVVDLKTVAGVFLHGFVAGIIGLAVWVGTLYLLKNQELAAIMEVLRQRFTRPRIVAPDPTLQ